MLHYVKALCVAISSAIGAVSGRGVAQGPLGLQGAAAWAALELPGFGASCRLRYRIVRWPAMLDRSAGFPTHSARRASNVL
jgi:hypothetical protein